MDAEYSPYTFTCIQPFCLMFGSHHCLQNAQHNHRSEIQILHSKPKLGDSVVINFTVDGELAAECSSEYITFNTFVIYDK